MTSDASSFPARFTKIDELKRDDHHHLTSVDVCLYLGDYTARKGYAHSATNKLIINFKKPMDRADRPEWRYKRQSICLAAQALFNAFGDSDLRPWTIVPLPPSKTRCDPMYDNRMMTMLTQVSGLFRQHRGYTLDVRELVKRMQSTAAAHEKSERPTPESLAALYEIQLHTLADIKDRIVICDDVLTTGCHFRAMEQVILGAIPDATIRGVFLARCEPSATDVSNF